MTFGIITCAKREPGDLVAFNDALESHCERCGHETWIRASTLRRVDKSQRWRQICVDCREVLHVSTS